MFILALKLESSGDELNWLMTTISSVFCHQNMIHCALGVLSPEHSLCSAIASLEGMGSKNHTGPEGVTIQKHQPGNHAAPN